MKYCIGCLTGGLIIISNKVILEGEIKDAKIKSFSSDLTLISFVFSL